MNVFISYAEEDKNKVSRLAETLRHGGGRDWRYVYDLHGAQDWRAEIQYNIDHCEVFLFVISEHSLASDWCIKELQHATLVEKPIVTVVFASDINIPPPLNTIQYILFDETPEAGAKLVRALQDPHSMSHDKIPSDWQRLGGGPIGSPATLQSQIPIPRIKRELTDMEKDDFLYKSIGKIRDYFDQALSAFEKSDPRIQTHIRDESNTVFKCQIFVNGDIKKSCMIWISDRIGLKNIAYYEAHGQMVSYSMNLYNELAQVAELDGKPALEFTLGMVMFAKHDECRICTVDKASECLWTYFTRDFSEASPRW